MMKRILVLDVGGTNLKLFLSGDVKPTKVPSGPAFTPRAMVAAVLGCRFDAGSAGMTRLHGTGDVDAVRVVQAPGERRGDALRGERHQGQCHAQAGPATYQMSEAGQHGLILSE